MDARHPVFSAPAARPAKVPLAARPLRALLGLYQKYLSPLDGPRCLLTPTCSEFARKALAKHGALLGSFLTADRLMQEHEASARSPVVFVHGHPRGWDPVEAEDFWWARGPQPLAPRGLPARTFSRGFQEAGCFSGDEALDAHAWASLGRKRRLP